jgi:membrane-anchored glycerophosphoryl diester phosphodiesterase (GDPDase)
MKLMCDLKEYRYFLVYRMWHCLAIPLCSVCMSHSYLDKVQIPVDVFNLVSLTSGIFLSAVMVAENISGFVSEMQTGAAR